ncbi:hypothetical protein M406DRAFT_264657 [Cryphonectria parasitica EP155]|uniref:Trimethylguanosine synthase n=1 Tax=Cryphonectria parasitica (strain ATCC 38755 / EP155) TaxID=660469 RepID=A0A9P5CKP5_CRYP1|nr:uncharacterized protein M406DRAFT_264657 [Cryphonectria parasitica EP155]KAF3762469.1 hypothetical protein M406DRAFT_264657 [Cryphonectria parasitica EP155]
MAPAEPLPLTARCKHYESSDEMPVEIKKYWRQRKELFCFYDDDIFMTDEAWFGVTAEPIAKYLAQKDIASKFHGPRPRSRIIIDLFAGAGGNTIAFARSGHWDLVIGIEIDAPTLACAQNNAAVYGLADHILWIHGDCADFLRRLKHHPETLDATLQQRQTRLGKHIQLFASPPWGGPMYKGAEVLDLEAMEPFGVTDLHVMCAPMAHAMFLPRNGDLSQLARLMPDESDEKLDVVQYCINGVSKGMVAYYPTEQDRAIS